MKGHVRERPEGSGNWSAVIEMRVSQDDGVDRAGLDREGLPIELTMLAQSLEHAAVHQQLLAAPIDQVPRAGDGADGAEERKSQLGAQAEALAAGANLKRFRYTRSPDQPPATIPTASPTRSC